MSYDAGEVDRPRRIVFGDVMLKCLRCTDAQNVNCCLYDQDYQFLLTGDSVGVGAGVWINACRRAVNKIMLRRHDKRSCKKSIRHAALLASAAPTLSVPTFSCLEEGILLSMCMCSRVAGNDAFYQFYAARTRLKRRNIKLYGVRPSISGLCLGSTG